MLALRANGDGLLGGPPTTSKDDGSEETAWEAGTEWEDSAPVEAPELRRGMGEGDDMMAGGWTRGGSSEDSYMQVVPEE